MPGEHTLTATINGYVCKVAAQTNDSYKRSVVKHQLIGFDGSFLEDMGEDEHTYDFETIWDGELYEDHEKFIDEYRFVKGDDYIDHPIEGRLTGRITNIEVRHVAAEINCVHISVSFVEIKMAQMDGTRGEKGVADIQQEFFNELVENAAKSIFGAALERINEIQAACHQLESRINMGLDIIKNTVNTIVFPASIAGLIVKNAVYAAATLSDSIEQINQSPKSAFTALFEQSKALASIFAKTENAIYTAIVKSSLFVAAVMVEKLFDSVSQKNTSMNRKDIDDIVTIIRRQIKETADADKNSNNASLLELAVIVADKAQITLSKMTGGADTQKISVKSPVNIYSILLAARVNRSKAFDICLRNNIENPNRVTGDIYLPESDY